MIENKIQLTPLDEIKINRDARFRRKLESDHIRSLSKKILNHGLIHAILIDSETGELIAGENRVSAFEYLRFLETPCPYPAYKDWTCIPSRKAKNVSELERRVMELSENLGNCPMKWQDISRGLLELQNLMQEEDEDVTQIEIAKRLGMSPEQISLYLLAGRNLHDPEIAECSSMITAVNIIRRKNERKVDAIADSLSFGGPLPLEAEKNIGTEEEQPALLDTPLDSGFRQEAPAPAPKPSTFSAPFRGEADNFLEWAQEYNGPRFNLIHLDPPYGINLHKSSTMKKSGRGQYEDSEDLFHAITDTLLKEQDKIISHSAHMLFWHSAEDREVVRAKLEGAGWRVWLYPLIWHKSCNTGLFPDSNRGPRHTYEMATLASRGDRKIVRLVADSYSGPATKTSGHESEKPVEMLEHFFRMLVDETTQILDPTGGSGNALRAAKKAGAAGGLFLELEEHYPRVFNLEQMKELEAGDA